MHEIKHGSFEPGTRNRHSAVSAGGRLVGVAGSRFGISECAAGVLELDKLVQKR